MFILMVTVRLTECTTPSTVVVTRDSYRYPEMSKGSFEGCGPRGVFRDVPVKIHLTTSSL